MISRLHLTPIVFVVGLVWLALLAVSGVVVELRWLRHGTTVVPVLLVVLGAFDNWLWKARSLNGWFTKRPVLCGTWEVSLQREWVNPLTRERPGMSTCYMAVRQTYSSLSMRLMTSESVSWLIAHNIVRSNDGTYQVAGVYMNTPDLSLRGERSEIHYGALLLDVQGQLASSLSGHYWTDRETRGTLAFRRRVANIYATYEEARCGFEKTEAR